MARVPMQPAWPAMTLGSACTGSCPEKLWAGFRSTPEANLLDRETALGLWTHGSAWFSGEQSLKGKLAPGQFADLAVLSADYFNVPTEDIRHLTSVMTLMDGNIVHADAEFADRAPPMPPAMPDWSPVDHLPSPATRPQTQPVERSCHAGCESACGLHGHQHAIAWSRPLPVDDPGAFWGALGCSCFAV